MPHRALRLVLRLAPLGVLIACHNEPPASLQPRMKDHARLSAAIDDAIAKGDLERARREATTLANLPEVAAVTTPWNSRLDAMIHAAWRVAESADLPAATANNVALRTTCSNCHASIPTR